MPSSQAIGIGVDMEARAGRVHIKSIVPGSPVAVSGLLREASVLLFPCLKTNHHLPLLSLGRHYREKRPAILCNYSYYYYHTSTLAVPLESQLFRLPAAGVRRKVREQAAAAAASTITTTTGCDGMVAFTHTQGDVILSVDKTVLSPTNIKVKKRV